MQVRELDIPEVKVLSPRRFPDSRGFFEEVWNRKVLEAAGLSVDFVQDNHSFSTAVHTLRGLHYQEPPFAQDKLVVALTGRVLDVAVDARIGSPTYGRWVSQELSAENGLQMFVPKGFLHGFLTLEAGTHILYKVSAHYSAQHDIGVAWNDPDLAIAWGTQTAALSDKDGAAGRFSELRSPFVYERNRV